MNRTTQQTLMITTVISSVRNGGGKDFCLRARAGTGKSTSMVELVDDYVVEFPEHEVSLCAFAKAASGDLQKKLEEHGHTNWKKIGASTIHSLGFGLVRFAFRPTVDNNKVRKLIEAQNASIYREHSSNIERLVGFAKIEGFGFFDDAQIGDVGAWYRIADHYDVNGFDDTSDLDRVVEASQHIYRLSLAQTNVIDFDDMVLFPLVKNLRVKYQKDGVILDEAQDAGRAKWALIKKFVKPNGWLMVVGDNRQSIMGFAGAQANALDHQIEDRNMTVLPLTVCWRCPKAVIRLAQKLVPDIEWAPNAIEGLAASVAQLPVTAAVPAVNVHTGEQTTLTGLEPTDAILCRNTAPLISTAYQLLRQGVACRVEGREIGTGLLRLVNRWKVSTIAAFLDKLSVYRDREVQKQVAKGNDTKKAEIEDRCDTIRHLCNVCLDRKQTSLDDLRAFIETMFADNVTAQGVVTLCTYHRAKGREWRRVFLQEHAARCPSPWARQVWQREQEDNLAYVALTRAMETLAFWN